MRGEKWNIAVLTNIRGTLEMDSQKQRKQRAKDAETWRPDGREGFDFDSWAVEVRRQMLASLRKREGR